MTAKENEKASYLTEVFVTEDGIEVPPPIRELGPRRLTRYREEAAAFYRALRDGEPLPVEPVADMPIPEGIELPKSWYGLEAEVVEVDEEVAEGHRFASWGSEPTVTLGKLTENEAVSAEQEDAVYFSRSEEVQEVAETAQETAHENVVEADFEPEASYEPLVAEEPVSLTQAEPALAALPLTDYSTDQQTEQVSLELPEPVRAIDAQGLDLTRIETEIDTDDVEEKKPWSHEEVEELPTIQESSLLTEAPFESNPADLATQEAIAEVKEGGTSKSGVWIGVLFLILVAALVAVWLLFFQ